MVLLLLVGALLAVLTPTSLAFSPQRRALFWQREPKSSCHYHFGGGRSVVASTMVLLQMAQEETTDKSDDAAVDLEFLKSTKKQRLLING